MSDETKTTNETPAPRANLDIPTSFVVEDGLPDLPTGGRTGQSKYSPLIVQAKALKINQRFKMQTGEVPVDSFCRNIRLAIKKAALPGVKVTAVAGESAIWIYRNA